MKCLKLLKWISLVLFLFTNILTAQRINCYISESISGKIGNGNYFSHFKSLYPDLKTMNGLGMSAGFLITNRNEKMTIGIGYKTWEIRSNYSKVNPGNSPWIDPFPERLTNFSVTTRSLSFTLGTSFLIQNRQFTILPYVNWVIGSSEIIKTKFARGHHSTTRNSNVSDIFNNKVFPGLDLCFHWSKLNYTNKKVIWYSKVGIGFAYLKNNYVKKNIPYCIDLLGFQYRIN